MLIICVLGFFVWFIYFYHLPLCVTPCGLGNALSHYCVSVVVAASAGKTFSIWCPQSFGSTFFANLPRKIQNLPTPPAKKTFSLFELKINEWNRACPEMHMYAPVLHNIVAKHVKKTPIDNVVIHYRMSDSPFNRHSEYPLLRYSYFKQCLRNVSGSSNIVVLCCPKRYDWQWASSQTRAVQAYAADFKQWLESEGFNNVDVTSSDIDTDFARMFNAEVLISSGSSLSYMAGLLSKNRTYVPNLKKLEFYTRPDFTLVQADYIPHSEVDDYFDTECVCEKLRRV